MHEASLHEESSFITLTYSDQHLPEGGSLNVRDWQLFAKRVRKSLGPIRYFACGEYGDRTFRPHYHAAVFGQGFSEGRSRIRGGRNPLYSSTALSRMWPHGHSSVGMLTFESAAYVARYACKKLTGAAGRYGTVKCDPGTGEMYEVKPEFVTMSRRPGIGRGWIEQYPHDVYPEDEVVVAGRKYRPPRYYDELQPEDVLEVVKEKRRRKVVARKLTEDDRARGEKWSERYVAFLDQNR